MNGLNLNSHPYWRASSRFENGFYRTKPPQEKSEAPRSTGSELSSTKRLKSENQVKIRPDLETSKFFENFNNAQSNNELANLFERFDDQLPLKNQSQTDSPELRFYNYLKTPLGMLNLESKISKNIKDELEKMTDVLKLEMARVSRERRRVLATHLVEYCRLQSTYAAARGDSWSRLLPQISLDAKSRQLSQEAVSAIAHKAEEKARKASQAAKAKATGQAGQSIVAADGSLGGGLRIGGDDAAIPSADQL